MLSRDVAETSRIAHVLALTTWSTYSDSAATQTPSSARSLKVLLTYASHHSPISSRIPDVRRCARDHEVRASQCQLGHSIFYYFPENLRRHPFSPDSASLVNRSE